MVVQYLTSLFECKAIREEHILVYAGQWVLLQEYSCRVAPAMTALSVEHSSVCGYFEGVVTCQEVTGKEKLSHFGL